MCIIAIKPKGMDMLEDTTIRTMFENNPDGAGMMYWSKDKVIIDKGYMTCESLLKKLHSMDLTDTNVILHFRIGTSGYKNELNCHPYPIKAENKAHCKAKIGMAHNGILYDFEPARCSKINDTQVFIQRVINSLKDGFQNNDETMFLIAELVKGNKLAFLDDKNKITTVGYFIEDSGYLYSNNSYKPRHRKCVSSYGWEA